MRVDPAEARRLLAGPDWDPGVPLLVVDAAELEVPPSFPAVVVAVSDSPVAVSGADVALCSAPGAVPAPWVAAPLSDVVDAIRAAPVAAVTLAQVLRLSAGRPAEAGLAVESLAYSALQAGPEFARWLSGRQPRAPAPAARAPAVVAGRDGSVLAVELNRPEVHNAYDRVMRDQLFEALSVAVADPGIEVVLSGRGPSFCSGGDLTDFGTAPDPATAQLVRTSRSPARLLASLAARTTARLHGSCIGSGIELPAFARTVMADPGTRIRLPELSMGLMPGAGGTVSLPLRIGAPRTAWLAITGSCIDAATAVEWGLVDRLA